MEEMRSQGHIPGAGAPEGMVGRWRQGPTSGSHGGHTASMGPLSGARLPRTVFHPVHLQREGKRAVTGGPGMGWLGKLSLRKGRVPGWSVKVSNGAGGTGAQTRGVEVRGVLSQLQVRAGGRTRP